MGAFTLAGMDLLKMCESCRLLAYQDEAGHWTIGWGHCGPEVVPGLQWTQEQADEQLQCDVQRFQAGVARHIAPCWLAKLSGDQFSAIVLFAYNVGLGDFEGSTVLRRVNAGQFDEVPDALMMWTRRRDKKTGALVPCLGLQHRREAECALWRGC